MSLSRRSFLSLSGAALAAATSRRFATACPAVEEPKSLAMGCNEFATDLYGKLRAEKGNLFFAPFSISTALAMTAAGAKGNTLAEMNQVLHLPQNPNEQFGELLGRVFAHGKDIKRPYELNAANALWAHQGFPWRPEFKKTLAQHYLAEVVDADFGKPDEARKAINTWVEKATHDKIKDLMPAGSITPLTRAVLANAVYFKADWAAQFKKELTKDKPFQVEGETPVVAPMMEQKGNFAYGEVEYDVESRAGDSMQVLEMPYAGGDLAMTLFLPRARKLDRLEGMLTASKLAAWTKDLRKQNVTVRMPKFKFDPKESTRLNGPLQGLGMKDAFDEIKADFNGMHTAIGETLHITAVMHKAFVDVNEAGTEAAGATGVAIGLRSLPREIDFTADRPFLFLIRDVKSGTILFMGRVSNPKG
jgi:serpin B